MVPHVLQQIASHIRKETGLSIGSISPRALDRAVHDRMRERHIDEEVDYLRHTERAPEELQALIEKIVVPETWFFRYGESFDVLTEWIRQSWRPAHPTGLLRILSAPCSTGEEPYSIAMALLDSGMPSHRIHIDALDISGVALEAARRGVYRPHSFRSEDTSFRDRYFHAVPAGFRLADTVRRQVQFHHGNILHLGARFIRASYDVVFCRNGLIYFDAETQRQIITELLSLLVPNGLLFVGPAEAPLLQGQSVQSLGYPNSFAYRKGDFIERRGQPRDVSVKQWRPNRNVSPAKSTSLRGYSAKPVVRHEPERRHDVSSEKSSSKIPSTNRGRSELREAAELADQGRLDEAIVLCKRYIDASAPTAEAYYLLGVLHDARQSPEALACYRKALYLQPDHTQALAHMALHLKKQGNAIQAQRLNARAQRAEERNGS